VPIPSGRTPNSWLGVDTLRFRGDSFFQVAYEKIGPLEGPFGTEPWSVLQGTVSFIAKDSFLLTPPQCQPGLPTLPFRCGTGSYTARADGWTLRVPGSWGNKVYVHLPWE